MRKRSIYRRCLLAAEKIVNTNSFYDKRLQETVNTLTVDDLVQLVAYEVGDIDRDAVKKYLQGVILKDSRGRGVSQRIIFIPERGWSR